MDKDLFDRTAVAIACLVGGADGFVSEEELDVLADTLSDYLNTYVDVEDARSAVGDGLELEDWKLVTNIREARLLPVSAREALKGLAINIMHADGEIDEAERSMIAQIEDALGLDVDFLRRDVLVSSNGPVTEIGVYTADLRHDEDAHGDSLPDAFGQARDQWRVSENDRTSPHYKAACDLLSSWYKCQFKESGDVYSVTVGYSLNLDNGTVSKDETSEDFIPAAQSEFIEAAFGGAPRLKSLQVVSLDFRETPSLDPLSPSDALLNAPEVGLVAIFEGRLSDTFDSEDLLSDWVEENEEEVAARFKFQPEEFALGDDDTEEEDRFFASGISWSGGESAVRIRRHSPSGAFLTELTQAVFDARAEEEAPQEVSEEFEAALANAAKALEAEGSEADAGAVLMRLVQDTMSGLSADLEGIELANEGVAAYRAGDFDKAMQLYRKAAAQGNADAEFNLGQMYAFGEGVPRDVAEGLKWWMQAAEHGNLPGQRNSWKALEMGDMHRPPDLAKAIQYARMAAAQDDAESIGAVVRLEQKLAEAGEPADEAATGRFAKTLNADGTPDTYSSSRLVRVIDGIDPELAMSVDEVIEASGRWNGDPAQMPVKEAGEYLERIDDGGTIAAFSAESQFAIGQASALLKLLPVQGDPFGEQMTRSLMVPIQDRRLTDVFQSERDLHPTTEDKVFNALVNLRRRMGRIIPGRGDIVRGVPEADVEARTELALEIATALFACVRRFSEDEEQLRRTLEFYGRLISLMSDALTEKEGALWASELSALMGCFADRADVVRTSQVFSDLIRLAGICQAHDDVRLPVMDGMEIILGLLESQKEQAEGASSLLGPVISGLDAQARRILGLAGSWLDVEDLSPRASSRLLGILVSLAKSACEVARDGKSDPLDLAPLIWPLVERMSARRTDGNAVFVLRASATFGEIIRRSMPVHQRSPWIGDLVVWMVQLGEDPLMGRAVPEFSSLLEELETFENVPPPEPQDAAARQAGLERYERLQAEQGADPVLNGQDQFDQASLGDAGSIMEAIRKALVSVGGEPPHKRKLLGGRFRVPFWRFDTALSPMWRWLEVMGDTKAPSILHEAEAVGPLACRLAADVEAAAVADGAPLSDVVRDGTGALLVNVLRLHVLSQHESRTVRPGALTRNLLSSLAKFEFSGLTVSDLSLCEQTIAADSALNEGAVHFHCLRHLAEKLEAEHRLLAAKKMLEHCYGMTPSPAGDQDAEAGARQTAVTGNDLLRLMVEVGQYNEASDFISEVRGRIEGLAGPFLSLQLNAALYNNLASMLQSQAVIERAVEHARAARTMANAWRAAAPDDSNALQAQLATITTLAQVLNDHSDHLEASALLGQALVLLEEADVPDGQMQIMMRLGQASNLADAGAGTQALTALSLALDAINGNKDMTQAERNVLILVARGVRAEALRQTGARDEALTEARSALKDAEIFAQGTGSTQVESDGQSADYSLSINVEETLSSLRELIRDLEAAPSTGLEDAPRDDELLKLEELVNNSAERELDERIDLAGDWIEKIRKAHAARGDHYRGMLANALMKRGMMHSEAEHHAELRSDVSESLELCREILKIGKSGPAVANVQDFSTYCITLSLRGELHARDGEPAMAVRLCEEYDSVRHSLGDSLEQFLELIDERIMEIRARALRALGHSVEEIRAIMTRPLMERMTSSLLNVDRSDDAGG